MYSAGSKLTDSMEKLSLHLFRWVIHDLLFFMFAASMEMFDFRSASVRKKPNHQLLYHGHIGDTYTSDTILPYIIKPVT